MSLRLVQSDSKNERRENERTAPFCDLTLVELDDGLRGSNPDERLKADAKTLS
jgi:hypothetical protein